MRGSASILVAASLLASQYLLPGCVVRFEDWALVEEATGGGEDGEAGLPEGGEGGGGEAGVTVPAGGAGLGGVGGGSGAGGTSGVATGGVSTGGGGGAPAGGDGSGGNATGGVDTGGGGTGGAEIGGSESGGSETGGLNSGGTESGGVVTGGAVTGGIPTGGQAGVPAAGGVGGESDGGTGNEGGATACDEGFIDCDDDGVCEVNPLDDPDACGDCGVRCTDDHGTPVCVDGACGSLCDDGFEDCPGSADYCCETDTTSDINSCGECGNSCVGNEACSDGVCTDEPCPSPIDVTDTRIDPVPAEGGCWRTIEGFGYLGCWQFAGHKVLINDVETPCSGVGEAVTLPDPYEGYYYIEITGPGTQPLANLSWW